MKQVHICCLIALMPLTAVAEGIVDFKPDISTSIDYDDNVFRFSSPEQAKVSLGTSNMADVVKRVDLGLAVNLRLSRQLISATTSISESQYSRFSNLNNTGKSYGLRWDWRLGSDVYGELSADKSEAIAGFNETRSPVKNLRTSNRKFASVNWNFLPDWAINASREQLDFENALASSKSLDRQDDVYEAGIRYQSQLDTQLGLAYRIADSTFPNRVGFIQSTLGSESSQKEITLAAAWLPTAKTRLSTRLSQVSLERNNSSLNNLSGFSQHWSLDFTPTDKLNFNLVAYQDVAPVDDVVTTYVRTKGFEFNPIWNLTSKVSLRGNASYTKSTYLGSAGISNANVDRVDESKLAGLSFIYTPTLKSIVQVQYQGEKRTSNTANAGYTFNNINFLFRYNF